MISTVDKASRLQPAEDTLRLPEVVERYFDTLNQKSFEQTAELFAEEGALIPPFEKPIVGRDAIAQYLATEANEMTLTPLSCEPVDTEGSDSLQSFEVRGKVKHSLFIVNVAWTFTIDEGGRIARAKIKLLASLKELLKMNR